MLAWGTTLCVVECRIEQFGKLVRHPFCASEGLFVQRSTQWFATLLWPAVLEPDGKGVSCAELAISFVVATGTPLPVWSDGQWCLEPTGSVITFSLAAAARLMRACFKLLV